MLSPLGEAAGSEAFLDLSDASLDRWPDLAQALSAETGIDVEYRTTGRLHVSLGDADAELEATAAGPHAARFDVRRMHASAARDLEPALAADVTAALLIGRDHRVNNRMFAQALLASATAAGADVRRGRPVAAISARDGTASGVQLESGEQITAGHVVLAAGAWSGDIAGVPHPLPVRPVRGQMLAVAHTRACGVRHVIFERKCYIIPRDDGRLLVGATVEDAGFSQGPTPRGITGLIAAAIAVVPCIADLPLVDTWAGFRPGTPDGLPVIGPDPDLPGLIHATGHFRNGILLAPITADCVSAVVTGAAPPLPLEPFSVARFR
jgi:glycine oxidase